MMAIRNESHIRQTPRVILRKAREGSYGDDNVLILELGLAGAKFEHSTRMMNGTVATFTCGAFVARGEVRHSILLPAINGVVYHTGVSFPDLDPTQQQHLYQLLIEEAQEQVNEWEANLEGLAWLPKPARRSIVARRYVSLRRTRTGWVRSITVDPNQPLDGVAVPEDTPETEIEILRRTYESADETSRELMRRMAMVGILERLR